MREFEGKLNIIEEGNEKGFKRNKKLKKRNLRGNENRNQEISTRGECKR